MSTDEPKQGVGAEPDDPRKRYCVEVPVTIKVWTAAPYDSVADDERHHPGMAHGAPG